MPLVFQAWILPPDCRQQPGWLFLFGDNHKRTGRSGQAVIRNEPNALGVRTKWAPSNAESAFWTDADFDVCAAMIDDDLTVAFARIREGDTVVCPRDGLGTGYAQLPRRAPRLFALLRQRIIELQREGRAHG